MRVPGQLVPRGRWSGSPRSGPPCSTCPLQPRVGDGIWGGGAPFPFGNEEEWGDFRSVSLFGENLCSPGVLPELLLLLGSLPEWRETGNSLRCRERYRRRGGDGGDRLPEGPPGEVRTAWWPARWGKDRPHAARAPLRPPGVGDQGWPSGHRAPAGTGREKVGTGELRSIACRPAGLRSVAKRPSALLSSPWVLQPNCFTAPKFVCPRLRGVGRAWLPALACVAQRLGARGRSAVAWNPVSDAQATGLAKGGPSGLIRREGMIQWRRSAGWAGRGVSTPGLKHVWAVLGLK